MPLSKFLRRVLLPLLCVLAMQTRSDLAAAADQALIDAARKEGQLVWYTTQAVSDLARPLAEAFQSKYGIHVAYDRNAATDIVLKITNEAQAGRHEVDVVDGTFTVTALKRAGLVLQWLPDSAQHFPRNLVDSQGYWVAINMYVATPAFNTELIAPGSEPRTLDDLLDPKWRGKMVWSNVAGAATGSAFVNSVIRDLGEDKGMMYLRRLAQQNITALSFPARTVLDQVIAGEYSIILQNFNSQAVVAKAKGAPIDWIAMSPATVVLTTASVLRDTPHPNAAKLFVDFLASRDGQTILRDADYVPADPDVPPRDPRVRPDIGNFRALYFTPEEVESSLESSQKLFNSLFK
jgi:ABC-type Fe3+ transport system substrate-binding protein